MVNEEEKEKYLRDLKYSDREIKLIMLGIKEGEQQEAKKEILDKIEKYIKSNKREEDEYDFDSGDSLHKYDSVDYDDLLEFIEKLKQEAKDGK